MESLSNSPSKLQGWLYKGLLMYGPLIVPRSMSIPFEVPNDFTVGQARHAGLVVLRTHLQGSWGGDPAVILDAGNVDIRPKPIDDSQLVRDLGEDPSFLYWPRGERAPEDCPMASQVVSLRRQEWLGEEGGMSFPGSSTSSTKHPPPQVPPPQGNCDLRAQFQDLAVKLQDMEVESRRVRDTLMRVEVESGQTKDELRQTKDELRQMKDELRQTKDELRQLKSERIKDGVILDRIARRVLLDHVREKVAGLTPELTWPNLAEPCSSIHRLWEQMSSILDNTDLSPQLKSRQQSMINILVEYNSIREEGNVAAHSAAQELFWEAIEALDEGTERRVLLSELYKWIYSSNSNLSQRLQDGETPALNDDGAHPFVDLKARAVVRPMNGSVARAYDANGTDCWARSGSWAAERSVKVDMIEDGIQTPQCRSRLSHDHGEQERERSGRWRTSAVGALGDSVVLRAEGTYFFDLGQHNIIVSKPREEERTYFGLIEVSVSVSTTYVAFLPASNDSWRLGAGCSVVLFAIARRRLCSLLATGDPLCIYERIEREQAGCVAASGGWLRSWLGGASDVPQATLSSEFRGSPSLFTVIRLSALPPRAWGSQPQRQVVVEQVSILGTGSEQAEFQDAVAHAILDIIALLKHSDYDVRLSAVWILKKVSERGAVTLTGSFDQAQYRSSGTLQSKRSFGPGEIIGTR
ncbi:hypothetical protein BU17DRAFT_64687 [Hysterangium stoloniferum]|nr:hypothetical protein BU17DRAFT_64687 [Hysterangium stoloniferum]